MAIISFFNDYKKETGQTLASIAIATVMSIEHNYRILEIPTGFDETTLEDSFFNRKVAENIASVVGGTDSGVNIGVEGLIKIIQSNRTSNSIVANSAKVVFRDRFDILQGLTTTDIEEYNVLSQYYPQIAKTANKDYNLTFVDISKRLPQEYQKKLLEMSDIVVIVFKQGADAIDYINGLREKDEIFRKKNILLLIGKYDKYSKYNVKNYTRELKEKQEISAISYNTLYFEATTEGKVPDFFIKYRSVLDKTDRNLVLMDGINNALIDSGDIPLSVLDAVWMIQGMYDGKSDINIAFALLKKDCDKVAGISDLIIDFRELADSDSKTTTPESLVKEVFSKVKKAADKKGGEATLKLIKKGHKDYHECVGLQAVGRGSDNLPCLGIIDYFPDGKKDGDIDISLVGKGITFDAGGICLKAKQRITEMKYDMCGAATVLAVFHACASMKLPLNVIALIPACENLPDGNAYRPADVIDTLAGLTVEIANTDAEGRLVMCDAMTYSARFEPEALIDVATLTGAVGTALGDHFTGLFVNDPMLCGTLETAADVAIDPVWTLPFNGPHFKSRLKSNIADCANTGPAGGAGASVAATFLAQFVPEDTSWAHLDIAATAYVGGKLPHSTGRPVGLLLTWLHQLAHARA